MTFKSFLLAAGLLLTGLAHADTVALWSYSPDRGGIISTKPTYTDNGNASFDPLGVSTTFVSQSGSSDTTAGSMALNTAGYAAQGTGDRTTGVRFSIDTTGFQDIVLSFDQRNSATASAWTALQYTLDGENWIEATTFRMLRDSVFVKGLGFDFSDIAGLQRHRRLEQLRHRRDHPLRHGPVRRLADPRGRGAGSARARLDRADPGRAGRDGCEPPPPQASLNNVEENIP